MTETPDREFAHRLLDDVQIPAETVEQFAREAALGKDFPCCDNGEHAAPTYPVPADRLTFDPDGTIDELWMSNASVHLEHLGGGVYMLIADSGTDHVHLTVPTTRRRTPDGLVSRMFVFERFDPRDLHDGFDHCPGCQAAHQAKEAHDG